MHRRERRGWNGFNLSMVRINSEGDGAGNFVPECMPKFDFDRMGIDSSFACNNINAIRSLEYPY